MNVGKQTHQTGRAPARRANGRLQSGEIVIMEQLKVSEDEITREATFDELGADSLARVEMVMAFEEVLD